MADNVYISSRVRLARNLKDYPFPLRMDDKQKHEVIERVKAVIPTLSQKLQFVELSDLSENALVSMVERHLISPEFAGKKEGRALVVSEDESVSIMINEEDHLRIQVIMPGLSLEEAYKVAEKIDTELSQKLEFAFDKELGYLTECPTNLGTGMRASVMMHLAGLAESRSVTRIASNLQKLGFTIRGTYGEGTEAPSCMYQLSNQVTLGLSEKTAIDNIMSVAAKLSESELATREKLMESMEYQDKISRSLGILLTARLISFSEAARLLNNVRMGIAEGIIEDVNLDTVDRLMVDIQPASLMLSEGKSLTPQERDKTRAELIKKALR
ncbi:MAG: protein arginine kinase [Oscillospiraceae bacterium]|nr:protein arginine kinase [Oscillospiraceae bacterium]